MDLHQTMLTGNLGKEPETRYSAAGKAVTNFTVASSRQYAAASGEQVKETVWTHITVWGPLAESCNKYLKKGSKVLVVGQLKPDRTTGAPRIWTGQDGAAHCSDELIASYVQFLSAATPRESADGSAFDEPENEIPF